MPPFLPIMGLNRSQDVSIGGQKLKFGVINYVDLGYLNQPLVAPAATYSKVGKKAEGKGLKKSVYFGYVVTATDAYTGETTPSPLLIAKTEAGGEAESELNFVKLTWTAVPNATAYNIYRAGEYNAGGTEAEIKEGTLKFKLIGTSTTAKYTDFGVVLGAATPPTSNNTYYNSGHNYVRPSRELQQHSAIGAYLVLGGPTQSNLDYSPLNEVAAWGLTLPSAEHVTVAKAKEVRQRSTAATNKTECVELAVTAFKAAASKERLGLVVYNPTTGQLEFIEGEEVAKGSISTVENETTPAVTTLVAKVTNQQILYLVKVVEGGTPTNVSNKLEYVPYVASVV